MAKKRLCKSRKNKMIGGVCGGLAEYLNMDPTIVRIIAGILCLIKGVGLLVYIIACIVMPYDEEDPHMPFGFIPGLFSNGPVQDAGLFGPV